ncbi:MAG TPA: ABC transporter ATP-binding protein [Longimicrobiales bacterium]|nr:ABC transporter ATP-binding protein [Longimicrobiales bacterium]
MTIIETTQLTKRYGRSTLAVDGISFHVERGQVFGFLGPNGSGKTTTIGMLLDIINPSSGDIRLFDEYGRDELHIARRRIGATLETPNFYPYLSGRDNLRIVARIKEIPETRIDAALDAVGLGSRQKDQFRKYSLGMKQRLAIAGAMMGDPELVILDEPANGLDPEGMREIREIIQGLASDGRTIFVSSHLLNEVERTCTHVAIIKQGRIVHQGSIAELTARHALAVIRAADPAALLDAARQYPAAIQVHLEDDSVLVELRDDDLAALNAFVASRGVHLSYLAPRNVSLEDVFMELTSDTPTPSRAAV